MEMETVIGINGTVLARTGVDRFLNPQMTIPKQSEHSTGKSVRFSKDDFSEGGLVFL